MFLAFLLHFRRRWLRKPPVKSGRSIAMAGSRDRLRSASASVLFSLRAPERDNSHGEKVVATAKPKVALKPKVIAGMKRKVAKKPRLKPVMKAMKTSAKATLGKKAVQKVAAAKLKKTPVKRLKSMKTQMKKTKK
ncbi:hypothetical protein NL676_027643 [Syzygium grande]|nr:hypothetical protein NL676_027643 [Syzygium grande]